MYVICRISMWQQVYLWSKLLKTNNILQRVLCTKQLHNTTVFIFNNRLTICLTDKKSWKFRNLWLLLWLLQHDSICSPMKTLIWETLFFLRIISLVQLSHCIITALWWERYSTPTHLSFEPTGFVRDALSLLCTDQNLLIRWARSSSAITAARDDGGAVRVCVPVRERAQRA